ncbi:MAG: hypothetical protein KAV87_56215 [Desulfobacteraceae bacterium]|nr:hypothetical protein [Desulfobacteraceae bacterium]
MQKPMIRKLELVIILLLTWIGVALPESSQTINMDQVKKLIAAVWQPKHDSFDIELIKQVRNAPVPNEKLREQIEHVYKNMEYNDPVQRQKDIEFAIQAELEKNGKPRVLRQRIRVSDIFYRLDQDMVNDVEAIDTGNDWRWTYVNFGDPDNKDFTRFIYQHDVRHATIMNNGKQWRRHKVEEWVGMPISVRKTVKYFLSKRESLQQDEDLVLPDKNLMQSLTMGDNKGLVITVEEEEMRGRLVDRLQLTMPEIPEFKTVLLVDKEDYSKVQRCEIWNANGNPAYIREIYSFDEQGLPRELHIEEYDKDGNIRKTQDIGISKIKLDISIPNDVFDFKPPQHYTIVDERLSPPLVVRPIEDEFLLDNLDNLDTPDRANEQRFQSLDVNDNNAYTDANNNTNKDAYAKNEPVNGNSSNMKAVSGKEHVLTTLQWLLVICLAISLTYIFIALLRKKRVQAG